MPNVLLVNNIRDIPDDRAVGKHTLATVFGAGACAVLYMVNTLAAIVLTADMWGDGYGLAVPAVYAGASATIAWQLCHKTGATLTPFLGMTSVLMFLYALASVVI